MRFFTGAFFIAVLQAGSHSPRIEITNIENGLVDLSVQQSINIQLKSPSHFKTKSSWYICLHEEFSRTCLIERGVKSKLQSGNNVENIELDLSGADLEQETFYKISFVRDHDLIYSSEKFLFIKKEIVVPKLKVTTKVSEPKIKNAKEQKVVFDNSPVLGARDRPFVTVSSVNGSIDLSEAKLIKIQIDSKISFKGSKSTWKLCLHKAYENICLIERGIKSLLGSAGKSNVELDSSKIKLVDGESYQVSVLRDNQKLSASKPFVVSTTVKEESIVIPFVTKDLKKKPKVVRQPDTPKVVISGMKLGSIDMSVSTNIKVHVVSKINQPFKKEWKLCLHKRRDSECLLEKNAAKFLNPGSNDVYFDAMDLQENISYQVSLLKNGDVVATSKPFNLINKNKEDIVDDMVGLVEESEIAQADEDLAGDIEEIDTQLPVEDAEEEAELSAYIDNTVALEEDDSNIEDIEAVESVLETKTKTVSQLKLQLKEHKCRNWFQRFIMRENIECKNIRRELKKAQNDVRRAKADEGHLIYKLMRFFRLI